MKPVFIGTINNKPISAIATQTLNQFTDILYNEGMPDEVDRDLDNARSLGAYYKLSNGYGVDNLDQNKINELQEFQEM